MTLAFDLGGFAFLVALCVICFVAGSVWERRRWQ